MRPLTIAAAFIGVLLTYSAASATPLALSDNFNPADVFFVPGDATCTGANGAVDTTSAATCGTLSWTHSLGGYDPSTDALTDATLFLTFYDDGDPSVEKYSIDIDSFSDNNHTILSGSTAGSPFTSQYDVLSYIINGQLDVLLTGGPGDFHFAGSQLVTHGTRGELRVLATDVAPTPEPGTLSLLALGIGGAIARRRRLSA